MENNESKVLVYSTSTCPYCQMVKQYLNDRQIHFSEINVEDDEQAMNEMIKKSGQLGVPVIDVGGQIIVGFNQDELDKLLNLK